MSFDYGGLERCIEDRLKTFSHRFDLKYDDVFFHYIHTMNNLHRVVPLQSYRQLYSKMLVGAYHDTVRFYELKKGDGSS